MALLSSWTSTLLTTSNELSAAMIALLFYFLVKTKEAVEIVGGGLRDLFLRRAADFRNLLRNTRNKRRLIALPAIGHRSEKRRICLDEHALERHLFRGIA